MVFNWIGKVFGPKRAAPARKPAPKIPFAPMANPAQRSRAAAGKPLAPRGSVVYKPNSAMGAATAARTSAMKTNMANRARTHFGSGGGGGGGYAGGGGYGGGGGGRSFASFGGGGGGGGGAAPAPVAPPRLSDKDWLAKDTSYQAMIKSLENRLKGFETENEAKRKQSVEDYSQSLSRLGWNADEKSWNTEDRTTAYGNAYQNLLNDFASRGLVQSSLYDQHRTDLQSNYGRQRDEMGKAHTSALEELARALSGFRTETRQSRDQARMEALARRASLEMGR